MAKQKTIKAILNPQVPFSKISPVLCTPTRLAPPEKPEARPPPLGFWINTKKPKTALVKIIKIMKSVVIFIYYFYVFSNSEMRLAKYAFFSGYFKINLRNISIALL